MAIQSAHEFTAGGVPHLDGPVPGGRDDVLLVEVHHVHGRPVPDEDAPEVDFGGRDHVPHCNGAIFTAGYHHSIVKPGNGKEGINQGIVSNKFGMCGLILYWSENRLEIIVTTFRSYIVTITSRE